MFEHMKCDSHKLYPLFEWWIYWEQLEANTLFSKKIVIAIDIYYYAYVMNPTKIIYLQLKSTVVSLILNSFEKSTHCKFDSAFIMHLRKF